MASRDMNLLHPTMREKLEAALKDCADNQLDVLVYCTLRTVEEQARLFRSGHSALDVVHKIDQLKAQGLGFLAEILERVGPQPNGQLVTNAGPGESYHNYGLAVDMVIMNQGKPDWASVDPRWPRLGEIMEIHGLTWAGRWAGRLRETAHVQLGQGGNPIVGRTPDEVRKMLDNAFVRHIE